MYLKFNKAAHASNIEKVLEVEQHCTVYTHTYIECNVIIKCFLFYI